MRVLLIVFVFCALGWAQTQRGASPDRNLAIDTVNVESDEFNSQFILGNPFANDSTEISKQIDSRSFAADPFFMRNIDREEFEQERQFLQFIGEDPQQERRKAQRSSFVPFPDPDLKKRDVSSQGSVLGGRIQQAEQGSSVSSEASKSTKNTNSSVQAPKSMEKIPAK